MVYLICLLLREKVFRRSMIEFGGKQSIMTPDGWKLVRLEVSDPSKTYEELYNIYTDPAETTNVIKQYPDVARKLKNMIGGQRVENARFHF